MSQPVQYLAIALIIFGACLPGVSQDVEEAPEKPAAAVVKVWRGQMANLLEDPLALLAFKNPDGENTSLLRAPVAVYFPEQQAAVCWDAGACRLVYAWTGEKFLETDPAQTIATPGGKITYLASGPGHFAATIGAYGSPKYFGFKLVEGNPEFHYTLGSIAIRERFSFSENGTVLNQHFIIETGGGGGGLSLGIPEAFEDRVTTDKGTVKGKMVTVSATDAKSFTLSYDLSEKSAETEADEDSE